MKDEGTERVKRAEIRKHYFLNEYVVIAPGRSKRPFDVKKEASSHSPHECSFCPGNEDPALPEIMRVGRGSSRGEWQIRVIPNKYPAFTPDNPRAFGFQEVVVETPKHGIDIGDFSIPEIEQVLGVYAKRTEELSQQPHIRYVLIFKNFGGRSGASLDHAHSQIYAISLIPPDIAAESETISRYERASAHCVYCDILSREEQGPRLIWSDEHVVALAPYASRAPYEAWILPRQHRRTISDLGTVEQRSLATALKLILSRLDQAEIPFNYFIHNSLQLENHHLHIEVTPRTNIWGGFELGSGMVINPTPPEEVPDFYRASRSDSAG